MQLIRKWKALSITSLIEKCACAKNTGQQEHKKCIHTLFTSALLFDITAQTYTDKNQDIETFIRTYFVARSFLHKLSHLLSVALKVINYGVPKCKCFSDNWKTVGAPVLLTCSPGCYRWWHIVLTHWVQLMLPCHCKMLYILVVKITCQKFDTAEFLPASDLFFPKDVKCCNKFGL